MPEVSNKEVVGALTVPITVPEQNEFVVARYTLYDETEAPPTGGLQETCTFAVEVPSEACTEVGGLGKICASAGVTNEKARIATRTERYRNGNTVRIFYESALLLLLERAR